MPLVVGEFLAGIAIGHSGLNLVHQTPTLDFLAEFGFAFLMFLSGLEVSFSSLSHSLRDGKNRLRAGGPVPLALANFALTLFFATAIGYVLQHRQAHRDRVRRVFPSSSVLPSTLWPLCRIQRWDKEESWFSSGLDRSRSSRLDSPRIEPN